MGSGSFSSALVTTALALATPRDPRDAVLGVSDTSALIATAAAASGVDRGGLPGPRRVVVLGVEGACR